MHKATTSSRRQILQWSGASLAATALQPLSRLHAAPSSNDSRILKTLKIGMIREGGSLEEKFRIAKAAGFDGVELQLPGVDVDEVRNAVAKTGLVVDGSVGASHWKIRHTSPDAEVRKQALKDLIKGIEQTAAVGGHTHLLVIGRDSDGPESELIPRSIENIAQAIPTAARHGITIAIENVWNGLCYDSKGSGDQSVSGFIKYVDAFNSPFVGMQFDIGNHWKFADPAVWIRDLGTRIVKLDIKGFSRAEDKFTEIAACDIPWKSVRQSLRDIGFHGWCAAEVKGGDQQELTRIANEMDVVLEQKSS